MGQSQVYRVLHQRTFRHHSSLKNALIFTGVLPIPLGSFFFVLTFEGYFLSILFVDKICF